MLERDWAEMESNSESEVAWLALYTAIHQWEDRKKEVALPVFPCYVFIRTSPERKLEILRTPGVFQIVSSAARPCVVPEQDIDMVRRISSVPHRIQPHSYLAKGELVRVRFGPFAGLKGVLARVKNQLRVVVSINLLKKSVALELDASSLEASWPDEKELCGRLS